MVFHETVAVQEVTVEEDQNCLYCNKSNSIKIGVSILFVVVVLLVAIGCVVRARKLKNRGRSGLAYGEQYDVREGDEEEIQSAEFPLKQTAAV